MTVPYHLGEYQRLGVDLSRPVVDALVATGAVEAVRTRTGWTVKALGKVGVVQTGGVTLWLRPKVTVARLLFLLGYSNQHRGWHEDDVALGTAPEVVPVMAVLFLKRLDLAMRHGAVLGYRQRRVDQIFVSGRLLEADQVRVRPGVPFPLAAVEDARTVDTSENRLLLAAARRLLALEPRQVLPFKAAQALRQVARRLDGAGPYQARDRIATPPAARANPHYPAALRLADLIVRGGSAEQVGADATAPVTSYLFDMPLVFEDFLFKTLEERAPSHGARAVHHYPTYLDECLGAKGPRYKPDVTWWRRDRCTAVIDAKYKGGDVEADDFHQVFSYCQLLGAERGYLVHVTDQEPKRYANRRTGTVLVSRRLDLSLPLPELRASLDQLAHEVADG